MPRGWQDDYETADERRAAHRAAIDIRQHRQQLQASAPAEARHAGTDGGLHHRTPAPRCPCGCEQAGALDDSSDDPLDILGRQVLDPAERYEQARAETRARLHGHTAPLDGREALAWLYANRPRNLGPS